MPSGSGAEVNAHTDKDHTAFHMRGHARDAATFVAMLGDIVQHSIFPEDELVRERQVLLQEYAGDEDDPMATAFKLFDRACYGEHSTAQPVIGSRANIRRFTRDDLLAFVASQYTGLNTIVGIAGCVEPDQIVAAAHAAFGNMPRGEANRIAAPSYVGGVRSRRVPGGDQVHIVLGFPVPALADEHDTVRVAAALFGEGMSSPFLDRVRERRGLVYHADCYTDVRDVFGQFIVEASTMPEHLDEFCIEVTRLLHQQAEVIAPVDLERARNQVTVRTLFGRKRRRNGWNVLRRTSSRWGACARRKNSWRVSRRSAASRYARRSRRCWTQAWQWDWPAILPRALRNGSRGWWNTAPLDPCA